MKPTHNPVYEDYSWQRVMNPSALIDMEENKTDGLFLNKLTGIQLKQLIVLTMPFLYLLARIEY